ncbi:unnamed protein product [Owenia fusiformis]|uniref:Uncharacterized protein n=1 Tax=Owenia fusiformis TaxID=6347 RepID=A0A8J1U443_OWEFU|nr:unnamed protein product [Owenia fusiformis]
MTYLVNKDLMKWPGHKSYNSTIALLGPVLGAPFVASNNFETSEHVGTHMDAPYHFTAQGWRLHQIPFSQLKGPAVVIDIREKASQIQDATLDVSDLEDWESEFGQQIPKGAVILMNSGWNKYWGNATAYVGGDTIETLHSPGFSREAVDWLLKNRDVVGFATDTLNCDIGKTLNFEAHILMLGENKWCVEMAANVGEIPKQGSVVYAMPMKIENGSGAPIRLYAVWDEKDPWVTGGATCITCCITIIGLAVLSHIF